MIINKKNIEDLSKNISELGEIKGRSLWYDARLRFLKNKEAVTSLIILYNSQIYKRIALISHLSFFANDCINLL